MESAKTRKREKSPCFPKADRCSRKKKGNFSEKKILAESDKGSWFAQPNNEELDIGANLDTSPNLTSRKALQNPIAKKLSEPDEGFASEDVDSSPSSSDESDEILQG